MWNTNQGHYTLKMYMYMYMYTPYVHDVRFICRRASGVVCIPYVSLVGRLCDTVGHLKSREDEKP